MFERDIYFKSYLARKQTTSFTLLVSPLLQMHVANQTALVNEWASIQPAFISLASCLGCFSALCLMCPWTGSPRFFLWTLILEDGWMHGRTDGWTDDFMDAWIEKYACFGFLWISFILSKIYIVCDRHFLN